jgi:hypothetical protein
MKSKITQQFSYLGSTYLSPANGLGGSRATLLLFFFEAAAAPALRALKQKGKKEGGLGEGIFALLRLRIERFRFSLIKRKPKQKIFHLLLKEKNGGAKKIKNVMKKFLFWFAVAERRQAETHIIILDFVQKKLEFQPKGTANLQFQNFRKFYAPAVRSPRLRARLKGLILKAFATLRVAKKKCFGFGFGSSFWRSQSKTKFCNQSFFVSPLAKLGSDNF